MLKPVVLVAGMGRCGSSLTMQMLHACGLRCAGQPPAFEPEEINLLNGDPTAEWMTQFEAVKIIDPHRGKLPFINAVVVWLDRNFIQQAISQVKFCTMLNGLRYDPRAAQRICNSLKLERTQAITTFTGLERVTVAFEDAIEAQDKYCTAIKEFLAPWHSLDIDKMLSCIQPRQRGAKCEAGLEIELASIQRYDKERVS